MDMPPGTRQPVVDGQFYPADPSRLSQDIEGYLGKVEVDRSSLDIVALVAPHAGYMYSGEVAAHAYRQVRGREYETVVVVAPSHRQGFRFSSVFGGRSYATPLGEIPVDRETVEALEREGAGLVRVAPEGHLHSQEHSLEVQLPFLQAVLGDFKLVPVVMGTQDRESCLALAGSIAAALRERKALIVASTDLSHFHTQESAQRLDSLIVERLEAFDPEGLMEDICQRKSEACGAGPAVAAMLAARELGAGHAENLCYMTSAARSGNFNSVVGYTAAIFYRGAKA